MVSNKEIPGQFSTFITGKDWTWITMEEAMVSNKEIPGLFSAFNTGGTGLGSLCRYKGSV